jgi:hypothetical protein
MFGVAHGLEMPFKVTFTQSFKNVNKTLKCSKVQWNNLGISRSSRSIKEYMPSVSIPIHCNILSSIRCGKVGHSYSS